MTATEIRLHPLLRVQIITPLNRVPRSYPGKNIQEERQQFRYSGHSARNDAIMKFHGAGAAARLSDIAVVLRNDVNLT